MQLWPLYMALTAAIAAVTWFTDRTAFVGAVTVLSGLIAMRAGSAFPPLYALTVWGVIAGIFYSTGQSLLACLFAVLIPVPYLFAVFGWPWAYAAFWSDLPGVGSLFALVLPTGLGLAGLDGGGSRLLHSGALPSWPRAAVAAMVSAQKGAPPQALERDL